MCCVIPICGGFIFYWVVIKEREEKKKLIVDEGSTTGLLFDKKYDTYSSKVDHYGSSLKPELSRMRSDTDDDDDDGTDDYQNDDEDRSDDDDDDDDSDLDDNDDTTDTIDCCFLQFPLWLPNEEKLVVRRRTSTYNDIIHFRDHQRLTNTPCKNRNSNNETTAVTAICNKNG